jgi:hypothetical protein
MPELPYGRAMKKGEELLGALISFAVVDFIAWELLGTISWPDDYPWLGSLILGAFVLGEIIVLWKIIVGEK